MKKFLKTLQGYNFTEDYTRLDELIGYGYSVFGIGKDGICYTVSLNYETGEFELYDFVHGVVSVRNHNWEQFIEKCKEMELIFVDIQLP